jgi:hypothetical protein
MSPVLVAAVEVAIYFAAFWSTKEIPSSARKWGLRLGAIVAVSLLSALVLPDPRAAAKAGEFTVYLGIPAIAVYWLAKKRAGAAPPVHRRAGPARPRPRR